MYYVPGVQFCCFQFAQTNLLPSSKSMCSEPGKSAIEMRNFLNSNADFPFLLSNLIAEFKISSDICSSYAHSYYLIYI